MTDFRIDYASQLSLPPGWQMRDHRHPDQIELEVILTGRVETRFADGREIVTGPGAFKWHPMGLAHREHLLEPGPGGRPAQMLFVMCNVPSTIDTDGWPLGCADPNGRLATILTWMIESQKQTSLHQHLIALLDAELIRLARPESAMVSAIRSFISDRVDQPLTLDDLANHVHLSRFHFCRAFRRSCGQTPMEFLRAQRLVAARAMRQSTGMPLRAIAPLVGFKNGHHLSRALNRPSQTGPTTLEDNEQ
ncbi:hypothetical protein LBMAG53_34760 [Planctomycetota bacterium]|nr:hypothetical protein LBMAG53_34760 [Planctomycetota bacterium]